MWLSENKILVHNFLTVLLHRYSSAYFKKVPVKLSRRQIVGERDIIIFPVTLFEIVRIARFQILVSGALLLIRNLCDLIVSFISIYLSRESGEKKTKCG
jgi:hypothetical protein